MSTDARLLVVADFNAETLARYLANSALPRVDVAVAPFNQVYQTLATGAPGREWSALVWTQPHAVIESFRRALEFEEVDHADVLAEVSRFAAALSAFASTCRHLIVASWTIPVWDRGYGTLDYRPHVGLAHLLARMNLGLADALARCPNAVMLDSARWLAASGGRATPRKGWYASKTPFNMAVFEHAAADVAAALDALHGRSRRIVIVDLDNVLWGGIVGEVGWEGIVLGGHDPAGEAFVDFQRALKAIARRGVQLAVASKNDEAVALEALDRHPEMVLRRADFAAWRIDWADKAANVAGLLAEVKLGADSAVFIDDSAIERARVAEAVPGILAPEWPDDPTRYVEALRSLRVFDAAQLTAEDRARSGMYAAERARKQELGTTTDLDTWLETLGIRITVDPLTSSNAERAAQLFNKTNQMNMATRRLSQSELVAWSADPDHILLTFRVADRFGDSGLTGIVGVAFEGSTARLTDFLLSCRVMGRHVEETMVHVAVAHARARGAAALVADFIATPRNAPCLDFFRRSGLRVDSGSQFSWDLEGPYPCPHAVTLEDRTGLVAPVGPAADGRRHA